MTDISGSSVGMVNLGCRLNAHESEIMRHLAGRAGLADAVIVNTCAVTAEAARRSRQMVRRVRRERPEARLMVTGCAAQIEPQSFANLADAVIGNDDKLRLEAWRALASASPREQILPLRAPGEAKPDWLANIELPRAGARARASVQIQTGCDHACTFCVIPHGRGRSRSVLPEQIVAALRTHAGRGHCEVVLTGIDLTAWGQDLPGRPRLGALVARALAEVPQLAFIRLSSLDVAEIDDELEALLQSEPRLAPYLHLSLQSGDDMILKRMKRRHCVEQVRAFCSRSRAARPELAFGADFIVGFPTETEQMFANTHALVEDCALDYLHVFPFSPRPGVPAERMPQLDRAVIAERAARLRKLAARRLQSRLASHVGRVELAIVESNGRARLPDFAPVRIIGAVPEASQALLRLVGHDASELIGRAA